MKFGYFFFKRKCQATLASQYSQQHLAPELGQHFLKGVHSHHDWFAFLQARDLKILGESESQ